MYIADRDNQRIRKITVSTGVITTIAGTGSRSFSGDGGAASSAGLDYPRLVVIDSSGYTHLIFFISNIITFFYPRQCVYR